MPSITIATVDVPHWQGGTSGVYLHIYANAAFTAESGTIYPATLKTNLPHTGVACLGTFYQAVACTVSGTTLTIPSITLDSTADSPDNPSATYSAVLWDGASGQPIQPFGTVSEFAVPTSPTSTTWPALFLGTNE